MIKLKFNSDGLIPVVAQDHETNEVLMVAYMNQEAFDNTIETKKMHYYSRSRKKQWMKGESSGHVQNVKELTIDCDLDTIVAKVEQVGGAACHVGYKSCFYRTIDETGEEMKVNQELVFNPDDVYKK